MSSLVDFATMQLWLMTFYIYYMYRYIIMEAVALYDFNTTADDELSFKKGSILKVQLGNV